MSVAFRGLLFGCLAMLLTAGRLLAQTGVDSFNLSFETVKPRAEIDSVHAGDRAGERAELALFSEPTSDAKSSKDRNARQASTAKATDGGNDVCDESKSCCSRWDDIFFYANHDGGWFAGAEYLRMRVSFSEAVAFVHRTTTLDPNTGSSTILDQTVSYDFDYENSARLFVGYSCGDCGGEIRFTWWNFGTDNGLTSGVVTANMSEIFAGQLENNAVAPGRFLRTSFHLDVNTFDLEFGKRIPLDTCDPCCPLWDLKWTAGLRYADVQREHDNIVISATGTGVSSGFITQSFNGAGLRMGLEGRRYCGECNQFSAYMKGNASLLLGDYDVERRRETPTVDPLAHTIQRENYIRMIPIAELEAGASWQPCSCVLVSAGYIMSAWWDLGMFEEINGTNFTPEDDSNIMAFDGAFARIEVLF